MFYDAPPTGSARNILWPRADGWIRVPYIATPESRELLEAALDTVLITDQAHFLRAHHYDLAFSSGLEEARYPFTRIAETLRSADIAFANLETPLSDGARWSGAFRTPGAFADGLSWAGLDVVSTANNHALDAEGEGLIDTMDNLSRAGVGHVGTGLDLEDARRPFVVERDEIRIAFFGYAQFVNVGGSAFATPTSSGVVPLDPLLVREDIARVRDRVDQVALSFHWGIENSQDVHPGMRGFAHDAIDAGADIILGHHPHVRRGIEVYHGKPIIYSMGNLVFGHNHDYWMDNILVRFTIARTHMDGAVQTHDPDDAARVTRIEILPVAGRGDALSQPFLLEGAEAHAVLEDILDRSAELATTVRIVGDVGVIDIERYEPSASRPAPRSQP